MALEGKAAVGEARQLNLAVSQGDFQKVRPIHTNKRWTKIVCVCACTKWTAKHCNTVTNWWRTVCVLTCVFYRKLKVGARIRGLLMTGGWVNWRLDWGDLLQVYLQKTVSELLRTCYQCPCIAKRTMRHYFSPIFLPPSSLSRFGRKMKHKFRVFSLSFLLNNESLIRMFTSAKLLQSTRKNKKRFFFFFGGFNYKV